MSLVLFGRTSLAHLGSRFVGGVDAPLYSWSLAWWPHAIASGTDPFVARVIFAPAGIDLAWVTSIPGPSLVMAPLTAVLGPVVVLNLLLLVSPALAGWAAYLVCKRVARAFWPAVVGGYLFGFSGYMVQQMRGHVNLTLIFPVPIAVYLVLRRMDGTIGRRRFTFLLALTLACQALISVEVFATLSFFGVVALALAWRFMTDRRAAALDLIGPVALAYLLALAALGPLVYHLLVGYGSVAISRSLSDHSADLLEYAFPTSSFLIGGQVSQAGPMSFVTATEHSSYLGLPLLLASVLSVMSGRRDPVDRGLACFAGIALLCSLGPQLHVGGRALILLPWRAIETVPGLRLALPSRFAVYVVLPLSMLIARWMARPAPRMRRYACWALVCLAALALLPDSRPSIRHVDVPTFFSEGQYESQLAGQTVLLIHGDDAVDTLWQAEAHFAFDIADGHMGVTPSALTRDPVWNAIDNDRPSTIPAASLKTFLCDRDVRAVVVADARNAAWQPLLSDMGLAGQHLGGVWLYRLSTCD